MKCKNGSCGGTIVNLGSNYGCFLCSRPVSVETKKVDLGDSLLEIVKGTGEKIRHRHVLHLGPIHVEKVKSEDVLYTKDDYIRFDPRFVLQSNGENYYGEAPN